jgi:hypothetical protein
VDFPQPLQTCTDFFYRVCCGRSSDFCQSQEVYPVCVMRFSSCEILTMVIDIPSRTALLRSFHNFFVRFCYRRQVGILIMRRCCRPHSITAVGYSHSRNWFVLFPVRGPPHNNYNFRSRIRTLDCCMCNSFRVWRLS